MLEIESSWAIQINLNVILTSGNGRIPCDCPRAVHHSMHLFNQYVGLAYPINCDQPCLSVHYLKSSNNFDNGWQIYLSHATGLEQIQKPHMLIIYDGDNTETSPVIFM